MFRYASSAIVTPKALVPIDLPTLFSGGLPSRFSGFLMQLDSLKPVGNKITVFIHFPLCSPPRSGAM